MSQLRVSSNITSLFDVGDKAFLYLNLGGIALSTNKIVMGESKSDVHLDDGEILLSVTSKVLRDERLYIDLFREIRCRDGPKLILNASGHTWCPYFHLNTASDRKASPQQRICLRTALRHGNCDFPVSYLEFCISADPWYPGVVRSSDQHPLPEICLDVFDEDGDQQGEHLGRAALHGAKIQQTYTLIQAGTGQEVVDGTVLELPLRPRSAREATAAAVIVRGTISINVFAARSLDFLQDRFSTLDSEVASRATALVVERSAISETSSDIVRSTLVTILMAAWNSMESGRHLLLHIVNGSDLRAPNREKEKERRDARSLLSPRPIVADVEDNFSHFPNAYCVVRWNGVETGRTPSCAHTRNPSWCAHMPLPLRSTPNNVPLVELSLDIFDDEAPLDEIQDHKSSVDGAFVGRLHLSSTQLWELRRITALRLTGNGCGHAMLAESKVDYALSRHKKLPRDDTAGVQEDDDEDNRHAGPQVTLTISDMAAAELPDTTLAARLFGRLSRAKQAPYVVVRLWNIEARSSTVKHGGTSVTWKHERHN